MKKSSVVICFLFFILNGYSQDKYPEAEITNGILKVHFYLPDGNKGYYMATRFDWSGLITSVEYKNHKYYGQWYNNYSAYTNDAVMGPVEEFGPIGYSDAKTGGHFIKIGVGALLKYDESPVNKYKLYQIANPGEWQIKKEADQIQFIHVLKDSEYSYEYNKTIRLLKDKAVLVIAHSLKNTGLKTIETSVLNHNFVMIDKLPTGPDFVIYFPFNVSATGEGIGTIAATEGNKMTFLRELLISERVFCSRIEGLTNDKKDYDFRIENTKAGAGVRITGDKPLSRLVFWAVSTTIGPEPYINIKIEPQQEFRWDINYEYYTTDTKK